MEECGNLSNLSATNFQAIPSPDLTAFVIVLSIASIPVAIYNGLIAILLLQSTSVAIQVRVPLINLLVETLITNLVLFCIVVISVALALSDATEPPLELCQFGLWVYNVTAVARPLGLLIFSVLMFQTVACSRREIRTKWLICSLVATWVIAILARIVRLVPAIYGYRYVGGVACYPMAGCPEYRVFKLIYSILWFVIACFVPLLACICISLATMCYIKQQTISEGAQYKKALAKFTAFLITGNVLNILGQAVPAILAGSTHYTVGVYITCVTVLSSFIPTPILIVVFLKPIQKRLCCLYCSKHQKGTETIPMQQAETA